MKILKCIILIVLILLVLAGGILMYFVSSNQMTFGGAPSNASSNVITDYIDEYKEKKNKMEKLEQLQANLEFVCKHEEKPE